ncbi:hypothetical protein X474_18935 [Dethiosulfatarculus sandiegensis]|uniref:Uncharacterized protein n=1 Tax=Dethiosulfatarculus sandiegensis TaxID=1429043 RepID=A0A0D2J2H9_9BACT|nr:hypothetical protein X474_18935 [Dethiosulfatarculus sandiegensis]
MISLYALFPFSLCARGIGGFAFSLCGLSYIHLNRFGGLKPDQSLLYI